MTSGTKRPNLFLIGAQKAGTTLLYNLLTGHPDIDGGKRKEPGYFSMYFDRGIHWYLSLYEDAQGKFVIDGSTTYSVVGCFPDVIPKLLEVSPEPRFLYCLRHPIERIESSWMQFRSQGIRISTDFNRAVARDPMLVEGSRYGTNVSAFMEAVSPDAVKVLFFDELVTDPESVLRGVFDFLELPATEGPLVRLESINQSLGKRQPRAVVDLAHRVPGYRWVADKIPAHARARWFGVLRRPLGERPRWSRDTYERVTRQMDSEIATIELLTGRDLEGWRHVPPGSVIGD